MDYKKARDILLSAVKPVSGERISLDMCADRVLAQAVAAYEDVPAFDRSPYDGYAFRAADTIGASKENPVTLEIIEEVPAGSVPSKEVISGTAVKVLTGAPIPPGADAVVMYEKTRFTDTEVTVFSPSKSGDSIIYKGEDVKKGTVLADPGVKIDPGIAGTLAAQGIYFPKVYRKPLIGIISTGSELLDNESGCHTCPDSAARSDVDTVPDDLHNTGRIRNTNRYSIAAALQKDGCDTVYLGTVGDDAEQIARLISAGSVNSSESLNASGVSGSLESSDASGSSEPSESSEMHGGTCSEFDMIILTGGVSAGDYDLTPEAMQLAGCEILIQGVDIKPGMACCYGVKDGMPVCALSGNPASSLTNYYVIVRPAVRKLAGLKDYLPEEFTVKLAGGFNKKSKSARFLKGKLVIKDAEAVLEIPKGQGNVIISSSIGCDCLAAVPAGSGPLEAGTKLQAFTV